MKSLETPSGKGVSFQSDTTDSRKYWLEYLTHGRILLDFLGLHSRETLGLKKDIGGLNKKSLEVILNTLQKLGNDNIKFHENSYYSITIRVH